MQLFSYFALFLTMVNKSEINLKTVPESGETYSFSAEDLKEIAGLNEVSIPHKDNSVSVKVTPIGDTHFEVKAQIKLKRTLNCSRCGADFEDTFDQEATDYLSLEAGEEGEDQGFLVLDSHKWKWPNFVAESVELETPYQNHEDGKKCSAGCAQYDIAVEKGLITTEGSKTNPFQALEKLKSKLN